MWPRAEPRPGQGQGHPLDLDLDLASSTEVRNKEERHHPPLTFQVQVRPLRCLHYFIWHTSTAGTPSLGVIGVASVPFLHCVADGLCVCRAEVDIWLRLRFQHDLITSLGRP